jgi:acetoin utilization deacetylase AcuC-like enzyme
MSTGYVYNPIFLKHNQHDHPENAHRLLAIMDYLQEQEILPRLTEVPSRAATLEELSRCHHPIYIEQIREVSLRGGGMLDADTYTSRYSYEAATHAAGGLLDLMGAVITGKLNNGFALVRPPGHHAITFHAMGFCLFNNIAIAARSATLDYGLERIAIVDFDVHHGNGTQAILDDDYHVMFVSSHQHPFYPGTGHTTEIGHGGAVGTKINLPLEAGVGNEGIQELYTQIVFPMLRRFQPELILVSAGFDAHWQDPLASIGLTLEGYCWLTQKLVDLAAELCRGRIVFTLEGGYNLKVLAPGVGNVFRILLGETECDDPVGKSPWKEAKVSGLVAELKKIHHL